MKQIKDFYELVHILGNKEFVFCLIRQCEFFKGASVSLLGIHID